MKKIMIAGFVTVNDNYDKYIEAFRMMGAEPFLSLEPEEVKNADALVLPGSCQDINPKLWGEENICSNDVNDELDHMQWELMDMAIAEGKPVLGICRGMQFINVYFGGTLIQDLSCAEYHKGAAQDKQDNYHLIFNGANQFMNELFGFMCEVNSKHHQGIGKLGKELSVASFWMNGDTGETVTEAIVHNHYPIIGLQWHPEEMYLNGGQVHEVDGEKQLEYFLNL